MRDVAGCVETAGEFLIGTNGLTSNHHFYVGETSLIVSILAERPKNAS